MSWFEKHAKFTLVTIWLFCGLCGVFVLEMVAKGFGLGRVVVYETSPVYGYRPLPNQDASRNESTPLKFNNLGFRAQQDWDVNQTHHKILFLGDSVTYGGSYIGNQQLFSFLALKDYPSWESANAGVNAWGVLNVHAFIKQMAFLPADIYVSVFPEGDFYRGLMRIGGQPFWTHTPKFALEELWQYWIFKNNLQKTLSQSTTPFSQLSTHQAVDLAAWSIHDLNTYLDTHHKKHLVYISPSQKQLLGEEEIDPKVQAALKKYNIEVIYLKDRIEKDTTQDVSLLFHDNIHLSPKGHEVWGRIIADDLKKWVS